MGRTIGHISGLGRCQAGAQQPRCEPRGSARDVYACKWEDGDGRAFAELEIQSRTQSRSRGRGSRLQAGVPVQVIAQRLDHAQVNMTLQVYAHAMPDQQRDAASRLGTLLASC